MVNRRSAWKWRSAEPERGGLCLVLHLNPRKRGSQEEQLLSLAAALREEKVPLCYVFSAQPPSWYAEALAQHHVDVRWLDFARPAAAAATLLRWWATSRPQLIHFHFFRASSPVVLAGAATGARVVLNDHVCLTPGRETPLAVALKRWRNRLCNRFIDVRLAVSDFVAETVATWGHVARERIRVVDNGINIDRFTSSTAGTVRDELGVGERPLIVCVSRLAGEKGVTTAVRAVAHLRADATLALVGDGPLDARLRALANELGIAGRVRFLGLRNDVERLLAAADVSIVPSEWDEAFGQAVVESMAAATPVIVTASGAMPQIVGDTGVVVPKQDPQALATAIDELLANPERRALLGRAAQKRAAAHYSLPLWTHRMVALYRELMPSPSSLVAAHAA